MLVISTFNWNSFLRDITVIYIPIQINTQYCPITERPFYVKTIVYCIMLYIEII